MFKYISILSAMLAFAIPLMASPTVAIRATAIDLGDVWRGDDATYRFTLRNTGDTALNVETHPNCACTLLKSSLSIQPQNQEDIVAIVHTGAYVGKLEKQIDLVTNDPTQPKPSLKMLANIIQAVEVDPVDSAAIALDTDRVTPKEYLLRFREPGDVTVTRAVCNRPYAKAFVAPNTDMPGAPRSCRVIVTIKPDAPLGRSTLLVSLFTTSRRQPQVILTLTCDKGITASPTRVYMGNISRELQLPVTQIVTLTRHSGRFSVLKAKCDDSRLSVDVAPQNDGATCRLSLSYRGGWFPGTSQANVTIDTDDPQQPQITVPVIANVLPDIKDKR